MSAKQGREQQKDVCSELQRNLEEEDREVNLSGMAVSGAPAREQRRQRVQQMTRGFMHFSCNSG